MCLSNFLSFLYTSHRSRTRKYLSLRCESPDGAQPCAYSWPCSQSTVPRQEPGHPWEFVRKAWSCALLWTYWIRIHILTRSSAICLHTEIWEVPLYSDDFSLPTSSLSGLIWPCTERRLSCLNWGCLVASAMTYWMGCSLSNGVLSVSLPAACLLSLGSDYIP